MESNPASLRGHRPTLSNFGSSARRLFRELNPVDLVGPLFFYDLVRLARRGRSTLLRCIYGLTLLGALCFAYTAHFSGRELWQEAFAPHTRLPRLELAQFSRYFILAVLFAQSAAVLVITPVYLAGAIAEEKERKTLILLFGSHLSDREIILGKLFARLTHLGSVWLMGLPIVLVISLIVGGVNVDVLLSTFIVTGMTLLSIGSISMLCSVFCRNAMNALMCSYGWVLALNLLWIVPWFGYLSSPIAFVLVLDSRSQDLSLPLVSPAPAPWTPSIRGRPAALAAKGAAQESVVWMTGLYVLLHGMISVFCIRSAIQNLRTAEPDPVFRTPAARPRLVPVSTVFNHAEVRAGELARPTRRPSLLPPPSCDPLLWKEMAHDPPKTINPAADTMMDIAIRVLLLSDAFLLLVLMDRWGAWFEDDKTLTVVGNGFLRVLGIATAMVWSIGIAFRTASSLCRERDRRTLAMLLVLPVERSAILRAKWLGGILRFRTIGIFLGGLWSLGLLTETLHPFAVLLLAGSCGAFVILLASMGLWFAQVCPDTRRAQLSMAVVLLVLFVAPWLWLINQFDPGQFSTTPEETLNHLRQVGLNPFVAWWVSGFSWSEWHQALAEHNALFAAHLRAVVQGIVLLTVLAGIFWLAARRRLDLEPRD